MKDPKTGSAQKAPVVAHPTDSVSVWHFGRGSVVVDVDVVVEVVVDVDATQLLHKFGQSFKAVLRIKVLVEEHKVGSTHPAASPAPLHRVVVEVEEEVEVEVEVDVVEDVDVDVAVIVEVDVEVDDELSPQLLHTALHFSATTGFWQKERAWVAVSS